MSEEQQKEKKKPGWLPLIVLEGVTLGGGALIGFLIRNDMSFYETLEKPVFAPPGWLFPVMWSVLYILMALSVWLVWRAEAPHRAGLVTLYFVQLAVNLAWPVIFFTLQALGLAFWWLILLWGLIIWMMVAFFHWSKVAGWLLTPYLCWTTFAAVLSFLVARMNP